MPISDSNTTDQYDNSIAVINGGTDNTPIGNVGDRFKVDASISSVTGGTAVWSNKIQYLDINSSVGTYDRGDTISSSWADLFTYTGSGIFYGFLATMEDPKDVYFRVVSDGVDIFNGTTGIENEDIDKRDRYNLSTHDESISPFNGLSQNEKTTYLNLGVIAGLRFESSFQVKIRDGGTKKFKAGLVTILKD